MNLSADSLSDMYAGMRGPLPSFEKFGAWSLRYDGGGWLYRAAVDRVAKDCFRRGYKWIADDEQIAAIERVEKRHGIKDKKSRALQLARLDGEGYVYMDDGADPSRELRIETARDLRFANVLSRSQISEGPVGTDPISEWFGQPEYYHIGNARVHPSRVCRIICNRDPKTGRGVSVLKIVHDVIDAAVCARSNIVDLVGEARIDVMKVEGLGQRLQDQYETQQLTKRYNLAAQMKKNLAMLVMDKDGEDYQQKSSSFAGLPQVLESVRREVSAALEIPHAILFGRDGGLGSNGEMDIRTYHGTIESMQMNEVQPAFEILDAMTIRTALGRPDNDVYLEWLPIDKPTDVEQQEIGNSIVSRHKDMIASGFPQDVMDKVTVNSLVEAGVAPGLQQAWDEWLAGGDDRAEVEGDLG